MARRRHCRACGNHVTCREDHWPGCPNLGCARCHGEGMIERAATPEEVDNGCELGVAWSPCPRCTTLDLCGSELPARE